MKLLFRFQALGEYAFVGEGSFYDSSGTFYSNDEKTLVKKQSYMINGETMPPQSTVFGTVRFILLHANRSIVVRKEKNYNPQERLEMKGWIGARSFSLAESEQDFGVLKRMSPVFIHRSLDESFFIRAPFDALRETSSGEKPTRYQAMKRDPVEKALLMGWNAKAPALDALIAVKPDRADSSELESEQAFVAADQVFYEQPLVGVRMSETRATTEDDRSFHIVNSKRLAPGYAFAVVVELDDAKIENVQQLSRMPQFVRMGTDGTLFAVSTSDFAGKTWWEDAPPAGKGGDFRLAALSPVFLPENWRERCDYAMLQTKVNRPSDSSYREGVLTMTRGGSKFTLADIGSVFFFSESAQREDFWTACGGHARAAGYNHFISYES